MTWFFWEITGDEGRWSFQAVNLLTKFPQSTFDKDRHERVYANWNYARLFG